MSDDPTQSDLTFVSTQELIDELKRRHDASLFIGESLHDSKETHTLTDWHGSLNWCIGLAERGKHRLIKEALKVDSDDED